MYCSLIINMYNQTNRERLRNFGTRAVNQSAYIDNQSMKAIDENRRSKFKTDISIDAPDSLQLFQEEINSVFKANRKKRKEESRKPRALSRPTAPSKEIVEIKGELSKMGTMLEGQNELRVMEERLEKLLMELQNQKARPPSQKSQQYSQILAPQPYQMAPPPPQSYPYPYNYPPYPYQYPGYPQYPMHPPHQHHHPPPPKSKKSRRRYNENDENDGNDENESQLSDDLRPPPHKSIRDTKNRSRYPNHSKERIRTKLRIYLFAVLFVSFFKSEVKKLSTVRKTNLKRFWTEKFQSQIMNLKNWLLETQKFALSIILEKKNLNLVFFTDKSEKVRDEKKKLLMQIVGIGVKKIMEDATPQKISLFSQILLSLCRNGSFAVSRFWTVADMEQICISEYYGFFRLDSDLQKYLIGVMVFIKVFLFNLFLQPHKFDVTNFPKKQQPISTNMKIISSVYYHLLKQILINYRDKERNPTIYKVGNWLSVKKQFIVECSQPLIYGGGYPEDDDFISGLFSAEEIDELREFESWAVCSNKLKETIEKLYVEMLGKGRLVKKNLKYKLYN